ncbi:MAG: acyl-CoA desaturase [Schleiferiaceae bacterium]
MIENTASSRDFQKNLSKKIKSYLDQHNGGKADGRYYFKAALMGLMYWGPFFTMLFVDLGSFTWAFFAMWIIMGLGMAGIGMNVMHDANHGSVSKYEFVNKLFGASLYLCCGNVFNWKVQHNYLHHQYTNIDGLDDDIDSGGLIRLHPEQEYKKHQKYQHIYGPFLYGLLTINWVFAKEFRQLVTYRKRGLTQKFSKGGFWQEILLLSAMKLVYFAIFILTPVLLGYNFWAVFLGFLAMHFLCGFILSWVFQLAHIMPDVEHPEMPEKVVAGDWIHQLKTTANFKLPAIFRHYVGGLDYQVEHHIFPWINHVHYPALSKIVKETAREMNVPYVEYESLKKALVSHMDYLKAMAKPTPAVS